NDGFAVFSENYYKNGWQVQIDNAVVPQYNVNYVLRGLKIPKGNHTIVFEFKPQVVQSGSQISLISSILFLILCLGALSFVFSKKSK
ncbi:MAG: YfhO family protein, partial [Bacteroidota bacterium]|nr:YfhO family protein [Bacteroidota bacterium]